MKGKMEVGGIEIAVKKEENGKDYICISDIARSRVDNYPGYVIQNWMRNKNTIEFLGVWEKIYNPDFNCIEFEAIKSEAGYNRFVMTPKAWVEKTKAIGIVTKAGRYGGTYAYKDIAFEFASWISVEFKLYLIKEFERLKEKEMQQNGWDVRRLLTKINYGIHTDAVKNILIPAKVSGKQIAFSYASEADILNVALFGMTAAEWKAQNPDKSGNMRDYANVAQLVCLLNLESLNAAYIKQGIGKEERLQRLNETAIYQMRLLVEDSRVSLLGEQEKTECM